MVRRSLNERYASTHEVLTDVRRLQTLSTDNASPTPNLTNPSSAESFPFISLLQELGTLITVIASVMGIFILSAVGSSIGWPKVQALMQFKAEPHLLVLQREDGAQQHYTSAKHSFERGQQTLNPQDFKSAFTQLEDLPQQSSAFQPLSKQNTQSRWSQSLIDLAT